MGQEQKILINTVKGLDFVGLCIDSKVQEQSGIYPGGVGYSEKKLTIKHGHPTFFQPL